MCQNTLGQLVLYLSGPYIYCDIVHYLEKSIQNQLFIDKTISKECLFVANSLNKVTYNGLNTPRDEGSLQDYKQYSKISSCYHQVTSCHIARPSLKMYII